VFLRSANSWKIRPGETSAVFQVYEYGGDQDIGGLKVSTAQFKGLSA
jgi:hypothetical protein